MTRKFWGAIPLSIVMLFFAVNISLAAAIKPWPKIALKQVMSGLNAPTYVTSAGDKSGRLFVLERAGTIKIFQNGAILPTPFLDITPEVAAANDAGLLGLAFPPGFSKKNYFYVYYSNLDGNPVLSRFYVSANNPNVAVASSEVKILTIQAAVPGAHQGGWIGFQPTNQFLYISVGDTDIEGDPSNTSQNPLSLSGKILRIDVEHGPGTNQPYKIPSTNPFVANPNYRPEIWALGLRNPFRCSFTGQGDFYIGDVGWDTAEEIDFEPSNSVGGYNYGWNILEGPMFTGLNGNAYPANYRAPVAYYQHPAIEAIMGGYKYEASQFNNLKGIYFFGDFGEYGSGVGAIWGLSEGMGWATAKLLDTNFEVVSFGKDDAGNIYVVDIFNGVIYQLIQG